MLENDKVKISGVSLEDFVEYVKKKEPELLIKAVEKGKLDINSIVGTVKEQINQEFSVLTAGVKARSVIRDRLELALATDVECYFLGMQDRPGISGASTSPPPASAALLKFSADGKKALLFEASTFDPSLEKPDETKMRLPGMGKVKLKLKENSKYEGKYDIVQLISYEPVPAEQMALIIAKAINDPRKFTADDKYKPIILLGRIRGVFTVSILQKDAGDSKKWTAVGDYPILVQNQLEENPEKTPVMKIDMEPIHGIKVKATFSPRRYTTPIVDVVDMPECIRMAARDIHSPKDQAEAVGKIMEERDVLIVGSITRVSSSKNDVTYMDVSAFSMLDAPSNKDLFKFDETAPAAAPAADSPVAAPAVAAAAPASSESPAAAKKKQKKEKPAPVVTEDQSPAAPPAGTNSAIKFDDVKAAVREYCAKLNMKVSQLTVESVKELICPSAKNGTIDAALEELRDETK